MAAVKRHLGNAEAQPVGNVVTEALRVFHDLRHTPTSDRAIARAGEQQHRSRRRTGAARHFQLNERMTPTPQDPRPSPTVKLRPRDGASLQLQRFSEAHTTFHRNLLHLSRRLQMRPIPVFEAAVSDGPRTHDFSQAKRTVRCQVPSLRAYW